jgi:hypothetical protein
MLEIIKHRNKSHAWQKNYNADAPRKGDAAPDFELGDINGRNPVRLSDFRKEKPVALIFGSFT